MFVSYKWLQEYLPNLNQEAKALGEVISRTGIEVEDVFNYADGIKKVVVGHVVTCEQHPNAEKLHKLTVNVGEEELAEIVCGAPNVAVGQDVIVALPGARLPGGIKIKKAKLRGEVSNGMICALQELGIDGKVVPKAFVEGIYVFTEKQTPGTDVLELLGLNDPILELGITPNRSDALSMRGVAYEVGAITAEKPVLTVPEVTTVSTQQTADLLALNVENTVDTPYYSIAIAENVVIKESPLWLQGKLMKAGIRPHNNVVDITNYILLTYGQPLHAFDFDTLAGKDVSVRRAKADEAFTTLDSVERTLSEKNLVITSNDTPIAIAGIMGGLASEVTAKTTRVALETALFQPTVTRLSAKAVGIRSEASMRFEKGMDYFVAEQARQHALALLVELADATILAEPLTIDHREPFEVTLPLDVKRVNHVLGTAMTVTDVAEAFDRLQFETTHEGNVFMVTVPSRRPDISIEADLLEEVGRIYGYDNLPSTLPKGEATPGKLNYRQQKTREIRQLLEGNGFYQAITYGLETEAKAGYLALKETHLTKLAMPMSEEHSHLRTSLAAGLLDVVAYNVARRQSNVAFYEIARVFYGNETDRPTEEEHLAGAVTGLWESTPWQKIARPVDFFDVKGMIEAVVSTLGLVAPLRFEATKKAELHPGRAAAIYLGTEEVGYLGQLHPSEAARLDLPETYVFELNLQALLAADKVEKNYHEMPRFPASQRDIAVLVNNEVTNATLEDIIKENAGGLLKHIVLFDVFVNDKIGNDKKSMAYNLTYFDPSRTLTDEEVSASYDKIVVALEAIGAEIR
ncbi:phenylalanine--tRNA ligase subunit beta [Brochothrix thermosphacta]|uniref:phenylalanine--tRNA ligase subunit beta n=1 Tax=Brochothrix thermosphacta TaxID=2756 RepID=UPI0003E8664C|nr:phenylalanine--tRNA ligase subunit beta [Brochothrix thermosphacta]EUJ35729.1 phenylalanyl-tRNA ligase subunit beta [Brochothrix thermosphacta DSM 20171 = FSL F6-1036]ODJ50804.1 phenylalanine--tRNA ligase subunit beta [Brochothrix thermosphacta DSM 20171 = FSL F6-1036]